MNCPVCDQELKDAGGGSLSCLNIKCRLGWRVLPFGEWEAINAALEAAYQRGIQACQEGTK